MTATRNRRHPLDRLGEARTFAEAVRVYRDACAFERDLFADDPEIAGPDDPAFWNEEIAKAKRALAIWREEERAWLAARRAAEARAAERMRAEGLDAFADAAGGEFAALGF